MPKIPDKSLTKGMFNSPSSYHEEFPNKSRYKKITQKVPVAETANDTEFSPNEILSIFCSVAKENGFSYTKPRYYPPKNNERNKLYYKSLAIVKELQEEKTNTEIMDYIEALWGLSQEDYLELKINIDKRNIHIGMLSRGWWDTFFNKVIPFSKGEYTPVKFESKKPVMEWKPSETDEEDWGVKV